MPYNAWEDALLHNTAPNDNNPFEVVPKPHLFDESPRGFLWGWYDFATGETQRKIAEAEERQRLRKQQRMANQWQPQGGW